MTAVQFITHFTPRYSYLDSARLALEGGCRWIQLRMKNVDDAEVWAAGRQLLPLCRAAGARLIVDDRVELALRLGADGVHLGRNDMPVRRARAISRPGFIIGGTANTFADVSRLAAEGADYIGCGPFRHTATKQKLSPVLGLEGYRRLLRQMSEAGISLPLVAIGGISEADIRPLLDLGVSGIALSGSILRAAHPAAAMRRVCQLCGAEPAENNPIKT